MWSPFAFSDAAHVLENMQDRSLTQWFNYDNVYEDKIGKGSMRRKDVIARHMKGDTLGFNAAASETSEQKSAADVLDNKSPKQGDTPVLQEAGQTDTIKPQEGLANGGQEERNNDILYPEREGARKPPEAANAEASTGVRAKREEDERDLREAVIQYELSDNANDAFVVDDNDVDLTPEQRGFYDYAKETLGDVFVFFDGIKDNDKAGFSYNGKPFINISRVDRKRGDTPLSVLSGHEWTHAKKGLYERLAFSVKELTEEEISDHIKYGISVYKDSGKNLNSVKKNLYPMLSG